MIRRFTGMLVLALTLSAGAMAADMQKLSQEVQRVSQTPERMSLVWWMPTAFWETALNSNPALTPEGRAQVLTALDEYTVFAMLRAKIGAGGVTEATSKEDLVSNSRLEVDGKTIEPVPAESLKPATQAILAGFKPALDESIGIRQCSGSTRMSLSGFWSRTTPRRLVVREHSQNRTSATANRFWFLYRC